MMNFMILRALALVIHGGEFSVTRFCVSERTCYFVVVHVLCFFMAILSLSDVAVQKSELGSI